jgi:hemerythrin-like domain-containing protein
VCDYCDCRSHAQIAALSADHEAIVHLLVGLREAVDTADVEAAKARLPDLKELLDAHTRREEGGVFVQLRLAGVDDGYVDRFERDHHELDQLLENRFDPGWRRDVARLVRLLGEHIGREESDLFPAAHQLFRPDQWDALDVAATT